MTYRLEPVLLSIPLPTYVEGMASTVTAPVVYFPAATAVCCDSVGVIAVAACVESWLVLVPLTVTVPAVPLATHPSDTLGVTLFVADTVAVINPLLFTLTLGLAVTDVAGVVAEPPSTVTGE